MTDFAFKNAADIMESFKAVFEGHGQHDVRAQRVKDFKDDEIFLISYLYSNIKKNYGTKEGVSKEDVERALLQNKQILLMYSL